MTRIRLFVAAGTLAVAATAARPAAAQTAAPQPVSAQDSVAAAAPAQQPQRDERRRPRRRADVITADELAESGAADLYQAVQRLRPQWLRGSGARSLGGGAGGVVVYQNNAELGGIEALRGVGIGFAAELRFLDGSEASNTLPGLGSRMVAGAIVVRTGNVRS